MHSIEYGDSYKVENKKIKFGHFSKLTSKLVNMTSNGGGWVTPILDSTLIFIQVKLNIAYLVV